ncbi:hypothetical protein LZ667_13490 [Hafnia alvei]|uniref:hypothetical protein n=1 Tax=Hafnia alvei TaxID=569 RepID=UPI001F26D635|nr:hypothetical protein [Hafnia alvei]MCE9872396.1 hypothetical protein [Hafnia alvei]
MVGMEFLSEYMKAYADEYILIGGNACALHFQKLGTDFRATADLDIVLLVESENDGFLQCLSKFLDEKKYIGKTFNGSNQGGSAYRFVLPEGKNDDSLPVQIELFSKKPNYFDETQSKHLHITPIETGQGISNFSAILLDDELYEYIRGSRETVADVTTVNLNCLLGLKSIAWHGNQKLLDDGAEVSNIDVIKHPSDMLRIISVLDDGDVEYPAFIFNSLQESKVKFADDKIRQSLTSPGSTDFETAIGYIENYVKQAQ